MSVCIPHESEETKRCQRTVQVNGRVLVVYWVSFHYLYDRLCSRSSGFIWVKLQHYWLQLQKHCFTSYMTCSAEEFWTAHSHLHNWCQGTNEDRLSGCESRLLFTNTRGHGISNFEPGERKKSSEDQKMTASAESQEIKFKNDMIHL